MFKACLDYTRNRDLTEAYTFDKVTLQMEERQVMIFDH